MSTIQLRCVKDGVVALYCDGKSTVKRQPVKTKAALFREIKALMKKYGNAPVLTTSSITWAEQETKDKATLKLCQFLRS